MNMHRPMGPEAALSMLAMRPDDFLRLGTGVLGTAAALLDPREQECVRTELSEGALRRIALPLPEGGRSDDEVLSFLTTAVAPYRLGNGHPRFFGWITSAPAPIGVLADLLATAMNANCGPGGHGAAELERTVCRWLMDLTGFPPAGSHGLLVSGGSMANLTALAVARHRACTRAGRDVRRDGAAVMADLVLYQSAETHACIVKAAELMGLGRRRVRTIPVDGDLRMRVDLLAEAVRRDREAGLLPFCVVGTAGTVNAGAIDPLDAIADLCEAEGLWFHVDGAYGGIAAADPALGSQLGALARADSLALDPHKWLCVPIECGCVLIRDAGLQHAAFSMSADYLRGFETPAHETAWPYEFGLQLTRGPRALKLAAVLMRLGRDGVACTIARHCALAHGLAQRIEVAPDLELTAPVALSIVCFRVVPEGEDLAPDALDRLNARIAEAINRRGRVFLTPTAIHGRTSLRACLIHHDLREEDLDCLLSEVRAAAAEVAANLTDHASQKKGSSR
jgi:glutamate/tyrosine decarboxylase-like PLP-dependent enzyme